MGGCLIGAFDGNRLAGFIFGILGRDGGELTIHSNMLAVAPEYRGRNLGFRLKLAQRAEVLAHGIRQITWTFDPMLSLNAHLNFGKLGVIARKYKVDFFGGTTSSAVDQAGTHRFWVTWLLDSRRVAARLYHSLPKLDIQGAPRAVKCAAGLTPCTSDFEAALQSERFLIQIPCGWTFMLQNPRLSKLWRTATRTALTRALESGYTVQEFLRVDRAVAVAGCYLLTCEV